MQCVPGAPAPFSKTVTPLRIPCTPYGVLQVRTLWLYRTRHILETRRSPDWRSRRCGSTQISPWSSANRGLEHSHTDAALRPLKNDEFLSGVIQVVLTEKTAPGTVPRHQPETGQAPMNLPAVGPSLLLLSHDRLSRVTMVPSYHGPARRQKLASRMGCGVGDITRRSTIPKIHSLLQ